MNSSAAHRLQAEWPQNLSYDKGDKDIDDFYDSINGAIRDEGSIFHGKRQIDIFLLAMAIGKTANNRIKLKSPSNSIRRDALTERETWQMCSIVLSEKDAGLETLADSKNLVKICEEYANGGMKSLMALDKHKTDVSGQYEEALEAELDKLKDHS